MKAAYPDAQFTLAGPSDASPDQIDPRLVEMAQAEGVIDYIGNLADVRGAIGKAQVVVLPSYREGTPRVVLEAMAMGRPIVTTDVPGCRETVVHGRNGLIVPPRQVAELAEAMLTFCRDCTLAARMGMQSIAIARSRYDVRAVNQHMRDYVVGIEEPRSQPDFPRPPVPFFPP